MHKFWIFVPLCSTSAIINQNFNNQGWILNQLNSSVKIHLIKNYFFLLSTFVKCWCRLVELNLTISQHFISCTHFFQKKLSFLSVLSNIFRHIYTVLYVLKFSVWACEVYACALKPFRVWITEPGCLKL